MFTYKDTNQNIVFLLSYILSQFFLYLSLFPMNHAKTPKPFKNSLSELSDKLSQQIRNSPFNRLTPGKSLKQNTQKRVKVNFNSKKKSSSSSRLNSSRQSNLTSSNSNTNSSEAETVITTSEIEVTSESSSNDAELEEPFEKCVSSIFDLSIGLTSVEDALDSILSYMFAAALSNHSFRRLHMLLNSSAKSSPDIQYLILAIAVLVLKEGVPPRRQYWEAFAKTARSLSQTKQKFITFGAKQKIARRNLIKFAAIFKSHRTRVGVDEDIDHDHYGIDKQIDYVIKQFAKKKGGCSKEGYKKWIFPPSNPNKLMRLRRPVVEAPEKNSCLNTSMTENIDMSQVLDQSIHEILDVNNENIDENRKRYPKMNNAILNNAFDLNACPKHKSQVYSLGKKNQILENISKSDGNYNNELNNKLLIYPHADNFICDSNSYASSSGDADDNWYSVGYSADEKSLPQESETEPLPKLQTEEQSHESGKESKELQLQVQTDPKSEKEPDPKLQAQVQTQESYVKQKLEIQEQPSKPRPKQKLTFFVENQIEIFPVNQTTIEVARLFRNWSTAYSATKTVWKLMNDKDSDFDLESLFRVLPFSYADFLRSAIQTFAETNRKF